MLDLTAGTQRSLNFYDPVPDSAPIDLPVSVTDFSLRGAAANAEGYSGSQSENLFGVSTAGVVACDTNVHGMFASGVEERFIANVHTELERLPDWLRASPSVEFCRRFCEGVGFTLANQIGLRWAIFGDDEDGVTLLVHSRSTRRQVSFEFSMTGQTITVVLIDEELRRSNYACGPQHRLQLSHAIKWLRPEIPAVLGGFFVPVDVPLSPRWVCSLDELTDPKARHLHGPTAPLSVEQRLRALDAWVSSHAPLDYEVDDSRESIYEGRGE